MKLPPLNTLRFFDVAAQTESFARAAERLHVTHGAVSRQVRLLEQSLGVELFERRNRALFLTAAGRALQSTTQAIFEQIEDTVQRMQQPLQDNVLVLSCEPTIAMRWLIPRLPDFHAAHPDIQLQLVAAGGAVDFSRSGIDLALRRDDFHWERTLHSVKICDEWMGPVCRAGSQEAAQNPRLLHSRTRPKAWSDWHRLRGEGVRHRAGSKYEHFYRLQAPALCRLGALPISGLPGSAGPDTERRAGFAITAPGAVTGGVDMNPPRRIAAQAHAPGLAMLLPEAAQRIGVSPCRQ